MEVQRTFDAPDSYGIIIGLFFFLIRSVQLLFYFDFEYTSLIMKVDVFSLKITQCILGFIFCLMQMESYFNM